MDKIGILILVNFGTQMIVDLLAVRYVEKIGYRRCVVAAQIMSAIGLIGMAGFTFVLPDKFLALFLATICSAIGGGLLEVMISPIVEAAPSGEKDKAMSLLHSFYCWGCVGFVAISTIVLKIVGAENWYIIPLMWSILPIINTFVFMVVPINQLADKDEKTPTRVLFRDKSFWVFVIIMICAGASEMGMAQWASYFAETGLHVDKAMGDIFGLCFFCAMMGLSRTFYGRSGEKMNLKRFMRISCMLCLFGYLLAAIAPLTKNIGIDLSFLGLIGCGITGLSVGIMWPGTFSMASAVHTKGGASMFAILALAGDIGCVSGAEVVGMVSEVLPIGLSGGLLVAMIFPIILMFMLYGIKKQK